MAGTAPGLLAARIRFPFLQTTKAARPEETLFPRHAQPFDGEGRATGPEDPPLARRGSYFDFTTGGMIQLPFRIVGSLSSGQ